MASKKKLDKKGKDSKSKAEGYEVSRYEPPLRRLVEDLFSSLLTTHDFPYVRPPTGAMTTDQPFADKATSKLASWASNSKTPRPTNESTGGRRVVANVAIDALRSHSHAGILATRAVETDRVAHACVLAGGAVGTSGVAVGVRVFSCRAIRALRCPLMG